MFDGHLLSSSNLNSREDSPGCTENTQGEGEGRGREGGGGKGGGGKGGGGREGGEGRGGGEGGKGGEEEAVLQID